MRESIDITQFTYELPEERIAKFPLDERDGSRLLVWRDGGIGEDVFRNIGSRLPECATLVWNNTRVIRARLIMYKPSGARVEIFCLDPLDPADYERAFAVQGECRWKCIIGNSKKWKEGPLEISFEYGGVQYVLQAWRAPGEGREQAVRFVWDVPLAFGQLLEHLGHIPIPPYLGRDSQPVDDTRYQTVYSRFEGSVAAPTAGLHFTDRLIGELRESGFGFGEVTLHVGAGTFLPVKEQDAALHPMHTEHFSVTVDTLERIIASAGRVVPVGTTTVRTLESLTGLGYRVMRDGDPDADRTVGQWELYDIPDELNGARLLGELLDYMRREWLAELKASTQIMIAPGYRFRVADAMITNFHQPGSTLLLLVSAFTGGRWREIYDYALAHGFRFLSYGDSCLLIPRKSL